MRGKLSRLIKRLRRWKLSVRRRKSLKTLKPPQYIPYPDPEPDKSRPLQGPKSIFDLGHDPLIAIALSTMPPPPLQAFHFFPALPTELRLLIWSLALSANTPSSQRRIVELQFINPTFRFNTAAALLPSPLLHANRESRSVALVKNCYLDRKRRQTIYQARSDQQYLPLFSSNRSRKYVFVSPAHDTVFFRHTRDAAWNQMFGNDIRAADLARLESIAFEGTRPFTRTRMMRLFRASIYRCSRLREVILLWKESGADEHVGFEGRGVHVIQQVGWDGDPGLESVRWGSELKQFVVDVEARWKKDGRWAAMGREPPMLKARHWCFNTRLGDEFGACKSRRMARVCEEAVCEKCLARSTRR